MPAHKNEARAPIRPFDLPTILLTTGGLGFMRPAPGTWGSLPPVLAAAALGLAGAGAGVIMATLGAALGGCSLVCVVWGAYAEQRFGRKDAAEVVADETAGASIPALAAVWIAHMTSMGAARYALVAAAFLMFRVFDITKPWPMAHLERLPRGWGVLLDDLMAGVYAAAVLLLGLAAWSV